MIKTLRIIPSDLIALYDKTKQGDVEIKEYTGARGVYDWEEAFKPDGNEVWTLSELIERVSDLEREKEIRFLALMEACKTIRSLQSMFDDEGNFSGEHYQDQLSLALEARQWPSEWVDLARALVSE